MFWAEFFKKTIAIFEISTLNFLMSHEIKSHEKLKRLKFGTKTSLLGYFNAGF